MSKFIFGILVGLWLTVPISVVGHDEDGNCHVRFQRYDYMKPCEEDKQ